MQINQSTHTTFIFCSYALGSQQLKTAVTPTVATRKDEGRALAKDYLQKGVVAQHAGRARWWHRNSSDLEPNTITPAVFLPHFST